MFAAVAEASSTWTGKVIAQRKESWVLYRDILDLSDHGILPATPDGERGTVRSRV